MYGRRISSRTTPSALPVRRRPRKRLEARGDITPSAQGGLTWIHPALPSAEGTAMPDRRRVEGASGGCQPQGTAAGQGNQQGHS
jgi:hypothetical protein